MKAIVNVDKNWGIGKDNQLLYSLKGDMKFFRETTQNQLVILGRKTLESFPEGKPLKNRVHVLLTRQTTPIPEGVIVCPQISKLEDILSEYPHLEHYVIGGDSVYRQLLEFCDMAYVTKVLDSQEADSFFPNLDELPQWSLKTSLPVMEEQGISYQILSYRQNIATKNIATRER